MIYYLYNTTGSKIDCFDIGLSILAGDNHKINQQEIDDSYLYEGGDLESELNSGNLILTNDSSLPPITQYTSSEAKKRLSLESWALEVNFDDALVSFEADDVQEAIEKVNTVQLESGISRYAIIFGYQGVASNLYLQLFGGVSSDAVPLIVPETSEIKAISISSNSFVVKNPTLYSILVNGLQVATIALTYPSTTNYIAGISIALAAGDKISVFVPKAIGGIGSVRYPIVSIFIQVVIGA